MKKHFSCLTHKGRWLLATLTLIFTLGISQMWAADAVAKISFKNAGMATTYSATKISANPSTVGDVNVSWTNIGGFDKQYVSSSTAKDSCVKIDQTASDAYNTKYLQFSSTNVITKVELYAAIPGSTTASNEAIVGWSGEPSDTPDTVVVVSIPGKGTSNLTTINFPSTKGIKYVRCYRQIKIKDGKFNSKGDTYGSTTTWAIAYAQVTTYSATPATTYTVTYKSGEGTGSDVVDSDAKTVKAFVDCSFTAPSGYEFKEWQDGSSNVVEAGASVSDNMTLTAIYRLIPTKYTVEYILNGPSGDAPTETSKAKDDVFSLAAAPSWAGHAFDGWLCSADAAVKAAGSSYTMTAAPTTFTAQWKLENDATFGGTTCFTDAAVNLASLFTSSCGGTVAYSLKEASDHASVTGTSFTADAAGNYVVVATQASDATYAGVAKEATITVVPAPTHMVENRLVITNGASWGSSIYTTDGTNITNLSAFNPSRTGDGAINVNKKTANGSRSTNISSYTSENADNYMVLSFTVADGKRLRVSAVNIQPFSVSDTKHHRAWLADANGNKIVEATADLDKDGVANVFANVDFSENAVYLTGTNYLKLWTWGSTNGYRLNTPIYIDGVISDIPATYSVTYVPNNGITPAETMTDSNSPYEAGAEVTLLSNTFTAPTNKIWSAWTVTYVDGNSVVQTITPDANGKFNMPAFPVTVTAQWEEVSSTYDITYVSAHGTAPTAANAASVVLAELSADGWVHKGWTANADVTVDAATVEAGTLIANGKTAILASDVTFTAVWNEVYTVTYNKNGGTCATASATWTEGDDALVLPTATKDNFDFVGWYDAATGGNKIASPYTPSASIELFAHYMPKLVQAIYSNTFDAFIKNQAVNVYYLQGESAPTLSSIVVLGQDAPVFEEVDGNIKVTISAVDYIFPVTKTAVAPYTYENGDPITFDGTETYVKTGNAFSKDSGKEGWKFSKTDSDWSRESDGRTRIYFFLGAFESLTFENGGTARNIKVYRNGVELTTPTSSGSATIAGINVPAMYAVVSNQTGGDGAFKSVTFTPWVSTTGVALKEGEDPISAKSIWESTSFTLTAVVTPDNASDKTITWTSSDDAVATVVNGVVTGVAANATPVTITASTVDGVTATCAVTVTAAPEPSAAPVITAQPASANYYEEASIAALEVVATGESLSYQWYLGADAIDGAIAATYQPTVSAIGSYVYHCVVTNTEAGNLPTSLASDNATITIAEDPSAIKLINKSTGAINTTNFITGVTANDNVHGEKGAIFGSSSSNASVKGLSGLNKVVVYNATTTQTKIKLVLYNTNSAAQEVVLSTMAEGDVDPVGQAISVPSKELYSTGYITYNSTKNRTFYLHTKSTNVQISQIQVIESGDELAVAGKKDYSLNLNKGRVYAYASTAQTWEGLSMNLGSNYSPATTEYITFKDNALSFSVPNDVCLTITPARAGDKYYVTDVADGTDNATTTVAGTPNSFDLTGGVGKVWYIRSQGSNVQLTNIAFAAPKCEKPTITTQPATNLTFGPGNLTATVVATVADGGTLKYQWYDAATDEEVENATEATLTTTIEGTYYVIVTNTLADHSDNFVKSNEATLGYRVTNDATLSALSASAGTLDPAFDKDVLDYRVDLPEGTTVVPTLSATATMAPYPTVVITNATEFVNYEATSTVLVTAEDGVTQKTYTVKFVVDHIYTALVDVTESTTWNWSGSTEAVINDVANKGLIIANYIDGANFEMIEGKENERARRNQNGGVYQGTHLHFNTTVAGKVKFYFRAPSGGENCTITVINNGKEMVVGTRGNSFGWSNEIVVKGDVVIEMENDKEGGGTTRVQQIVFTELTPDYTRDVTNNIGTLCVNHNVMVGGAMGATFYQIAGLNATYPDKIDFDEVAPNEELKAGEPYIFQSTTGRIDLFYAEGDAVTEPVVVHGMHGVLVAGHLDITEDNMMDVYYISENKLRDCSNLVSTGLTLVANRAYIVMSEIDAAPAQPAPGRRRISIGGANAPAVVTGVDNLNAGEQPVKLIIDGQMYILRGEKMYDATGRLVK